MAGRTLEVNPSLNRFASGRRWKTLTRLDVPSRVDCGLRRDLVVLARVGERRAELGFDQRIAEGERAAAAPLREVLVRAQLVVEVDARAERTVEQVRLEEPQVHELAEAADLRLQRERLAVAEQVRLLDLRGSDEVLDAREARADLERAGRTFADLDVDVHPVGCRALLGRDVDALEVAERRDAASRFLEQRLAEEVALGDLHLATDHLVARLRVAADLDALEVHERAALDRNDDVDLVGHGVELRLRSRVDVGVAVVAVERANGLQILEQLRRG